MKHLVVVLACLILSTAAFASSSSLTPLFIGEIMRGNTVVAAPSQSVAWSGNPAALAGQKVDGATGDVAMDNAASFATNISGSDDAWGLSYGGTNVLKGWGIGAGYVDTDYSKGYGIGYGMPLKGLEVGVNWRRSEFDYAPSMEYASAAQATPRSRKESLFDVGVRKVWTYGEGEGMKGVSSIAGGAVLRDITDEIDTIVDLGVSFNFNSGFVVNVDLLDFDVFNAGVSKRFGSASEWELGAGLADGDLTLGAIYDIAKNGEPTAWRVGIAWADYDWDDVLYAGAYYKW